MNRQIIAILGVLLMFSTSAFAEVKRGPVTNLPIPRFVSLKAAEGNARRGPALSHRIDWVFVRRNMPLQVVAEYGHWRKVLDQEGAGGWVHYALLSGTRHVIVTQDSLDGFQRPDPTSPVRAQFQKGVVARLGQCTETLCRISKDGHRGWVTRDALWGVMPGEIRD